MNDEEQVQGRGQSGIGKTRNEREMEKKRRPSPTQVPDEGPRLSNSYIGMMAGVALIFDLLSGSLGLIAPGVGDIASDLFIDPFGIIVMTFMFKIKGVKFQKGNKMTALIIPFVFKFIPLFSIFPDFTVDVLWVSRLDRKAEAAGDEE